ncbi:MAG TPA: aromatic acid exporter family protein [Mycobacteriales bacterium]
MGRVRWRQLWRRARATLFRRGRRPGLRTAKTTLAAVLSFAIADALNTSDQPVLAPLTALLVVQLTLYETVEHGLERILSVTAGVLVAIGVASIVGLTWWSLGLVVMLSIIVGRAMRLGPHLLEVPISAMLVLAVSNAEDVAVDRVYETLIGSAVGVLVNLLIAPPLYLQPAGDALAELADKLAEYMRGLARQLRTGWSAQAADHWLQEARALGREVVRADETLARAEQSTRLNPRGGAARTLQPRMRAAQTGLELTYVSVRNLSRALLDRTYYVPPDEQADAYPPAIRAALADVLDSMAAAVWEIGEINTPAGAGDLPGRAEEQLDELLRRRDRLAELLHVDPAVDPGAWEQFGALLSAVDRIRVEVAAAVRPQQREWRPPRVTERQRAAFRRAVEARTRRRAQSTARHPDAPQSTVPHPTAPHPAEAPPRSAQSGAAQSGAAQSGDGQSGGAQSAAARADRVEAGSAPSDGAKRGGAEPGRAADARTGAEGFRAADLDEGRGGLSG